ncbi:MAG: hypothetical protein ACYDER_22800 [Ktedonobacteraceae bacterium]
MSKGSKHQRLCSIQVSAGARLHVQLIDPYGTYGFRKGGIGIALSQPRTYVTATIDTHAFEQEPDDALKYEILQEMATLGIHVKADFSLFVENNVPLHIGLGSETVTRTVARIAMLRLLGIPLQTEGLNLFSLASLTGAGMYAVLHGGLVVSGGLPLHTPMPEQVLAHEFVKRKVPPLIANLEIPSSWIVLLCIPQNHHIVGPSGEEERKFYTSLPAPDLQELHQCSHRILGQLLPSIGTGDYEAFAESMRMITKAIWKPFEQRVYGSYWEQMSRHFLDEGAPFVAITSCGPTCYTIIDSDGVDITSLSKRIAQRTAGMGEVIIANIASDGYSLQEKYQE